MKEKLEKEEKKEEFKKVEESPKKLEKDIKKMDNKKSKKKYIVIACIIAAVVVIGVLLSTIFALVNIENEKMISGISIEGIEVSGLTKEEAKAKVEAIYNQKKEKEINIKYEDYESTLNPTLMEVEYNVDKAVETAYKIGRTENIFVNNYEILKTLIMKENVDVEMTLNEDVTKQNIQDISVNLPGVVIESSYSVEDDELIITKGKAGVIVDTDKLYEEVKENLNNINANDEIIEIPVSQKEPEEIDIQKIHDEIYKEAQDAYYTKNPFTVYPEVEGVDFDVESAKKILEEEKDEYVIKLTITKPKVTISQIGSEAFPDQLATFTTRYDVSDVDRSTNLRIACQKINGKVVLAGDTFSYNQALGKRTEAAGYKNGKVYEAGQVVDGIGGGICQISSTLYNTALLANLDIVERRNHQFVTSYVPAGRDATVVYGVTDFKFKNTRKYPVRIVASANNGIATISMYGIKEENEYTFKFSTKTVASIPTTTKYVEEASLPAGTEKVKQKGANGLKTETYITKMLNGKVISTKLLSKDTYDAMQRIVLKGTSGSTTTTPSNNLPVTEQPKAEENTGTENNVDKKDETPQAPKETGTSSEQTEQ
ncbi:MAG: VanW family protein [Clostridia bacterium]